MPVNSLLLNFKRINLKNIIFLTIVFFLFFTGGIKAQTILYSQDFGTGTGFPTGWSANPSNSWSINNAITSSGYTGASGGSNARIEFNNNANAYLVFDNNLSTVGYSNITVSWGGRRYTDDYRTLYFQWSSDGTTWNSVSFTDNPADANWYLINGSVRITLPSSAENVSNLRFRWYEYDPDQGYRLDDFTVQGTSVTSGTSVEITTPGSSTYTVPTGVTCIKVECWGGGGRGGSRSLGNPGAGGGGGGGAYSSSFINVPSGVGYSVYLGAGSSSTSSGEDTYFNDASTVMAKGGNSVPNNTTNGAAGGAASESIGTYKYSGGNGANGISGNYGGGGGSSAGTGANGSNGNTSYGGTAPAGGGNGGNGGTAAGMNGFPGITPGGGGGGARGNNVTGGNGANGRIRISYAIDLSNLSTSATSPCQGSSSTVTLTSSSLSAGTYSVNYTLSGANTGTATASVTFSGGSGTFTTAALANSGSTTVTINYFTLTGWCNSTPISGNTASFTVETTPSTPGVISGSNAVCPNSGGNVYTISAVSGATTYTWSVPSGWSINSGQGTTSISVNAGASGGTISVTAGNSCGTSAASNLNVSIADFYASISVASPTSPCSANGSATVIAAGGSGSYSYSWSTGSTDQTITGLNIGDYSVTVTDNSCFVNRTYYTSVSLSYGADCGIPGKDGDASIASAPNSYFTGTGSSATLRPGASQIELSGDLSSLTEGDILLIIQMQGADINTSNSSSYGNISNVTAGNYEYVVVQDVVSSYVVLKTSTPIQRTYVNEESTSTTTRKRYQVLKVPQYDDLTISNNITVPSWDGSTGGVFAIDVAGTLDMNGYTISANGAGFRGGATASQAGSGFGANNDYYFLSTRNGHGYKGEGIAGAPAYVGASVATGTDYPGGWGKGQGAPGNAGGGGNDADVTNNDENSGGGGGANISAGGNGGDPWNSTNFRAGIGGDGGKPFSGSASSVIMGGGGGGGTSNNGNIPYGGNGGGIIIIHAATITGTGTITSNGNGGMPGTPNTGNDGGGGGGAGGSIIISADVNNGSLTLNANGGRGSDAETDGSAHGPGGGGGGGAIYYSIGSGNTPSTSSNAGANGVTTTASIAYGSSSGSAGTSSSVGEGSFSTTIFGRNCPAPDDTDPTINCPSNLSVCSGSEPAAYSSYAEFVSAGGSASDESGGSGLSTTCFGLLSEVSGNPITRTYRIYDNAGNYNTCQQTIAIQNIASSVALTSNDSECPQLIETQGFEPENGSYDEGTTEIVFTVSRLYSSTGTWDFSYNISGGTAENVTPAQSSGTAGNGTYNGLSGTSIDLHFFITNVTNTPITITLTVTDISDSNGCSSSVDSSDDVDILAMPAVGSFN